MDQFDEDKNKRIQRKNPFDFINDLDFERILKDMQRMFESTSFQEMIKKSYIGTLTSNKHFINTLNINIITNVRPKPPRFSNLSLKYHQGERISSNEHNPLIDIIKGDEEVAVTIKIPDVEKGEINLNATENTLEIIVNNLEKKYHKFLNLPARIKPKTVKTTYKNGVLDIVLKRKKK